MELSVRPDDLVAGATALRQAHAALDAARAEFTATAARLYPRLGPQAAETARVAMSAADQGCGLVEDDVASFAQGLTAAAAYYAAVDSHALGRLVVQP